ncbi:MAG TPA: tetratricopeptide repeat protein, partial [Candidatus Polarisedimenticolia bacterium]|nr:tetratricopeptide repeat protein [Candidatus Polarisedimenticolia bacterium]
FFGWLLAGFLLTYLHILAVGNIAHLSGLVTGLLLGHAFYGVSRRKLSLVALPALCLAAIIPLFWAPWSLDWLGFKAVQAHSGERYLEAVDWYTTMLDKEPRNAWALYNRGVLFHELGMSAEADRDIGMALELDPNIAVPATDPGGH